MSAYSTRSLAVLFALLALQSRPVEVPAQIPEGEITEWIAEQNQCSPDSIRISSLDYFDFAGDGRQEAVVNAYTCNTGIAGPDVSTVLARGPDRKLRELSIPPADPKNLDTLFGPGSASLSVYNGRLVFTYSDSSGRQAPVAIWYKWSGESFVVDEVVKSRPYKTSYDCSRARFDDERAICYVESLASLDLQLDALYRARLKTLPDARRVSFRQEQRKWLAVRGDACPIDAQWVECFTSYYRSRIDQLKQE